MAKCHISPHDEVPPPHGEVPLPHSEVLVPPPHDEVLLPHGEVPPPHNGICSVPYAGSFDTNPPPYRTASYTTD